ncbi:MAG: lipopolysaccharide biosynthesis protein [Fibrobacter sp.]|uniref:lipopolysaccharide biosynthesis protein n=1 Tax=Fibrobacter sp. UWP2 TaxID=1896216 RepID=UPI0013564D00|nr:lipopolysaccharide biosynthesis protein [Fibrobacter sp. UWP2]MCR5378011.1 lipopolysaccharide biosynthesis protein [Fibrobacter sp.]
MAWTGIEKIVNKAVNFLIGIALARMLAPTDYGVIGMLAIFIAVANTFTDSGLSNALIQKQDRTEKDFCTIFYFNIVVAIGFYLALFFASPYIAQFYNMPILEDVTKVVALSLIITGFTAVQRTRLTIDLRFQTQALISVISLLVTGAVGLILAYLGFGVWALVFQALAGQLISSICIWYCSRWMPKLIFSKTSFKQLFGFGSKLLCSSLINTIYGNLYTLVIGKAFSPADVGFYNKGNEYALLPTQAMQDMTLKVNYPILAKMQDDNERLLRAYRKLLRTPLFLLYPVLTVIAVTAEPLIEVMIGPKWLPCVPILQVLCFGYMFSPLTHINLNLLYVKGRTDLVLKLELIKKPIGFAILFATLPFGIYAMVIGKAAYEFIAFSFNCYYTGKILNYGEIKQLRVLIPVFVQIAVMGVVTHFAMIPFDGSVAKVAVGIVTAAVVYFGIAAIVKDESFMDFKEIILSKIRPSRAQ